LARPLRLQIGAADLAQYPIVRTVSPIITDDWPVWLQHAGSEIDSFSNEIYCATLSFSMHAILEGLGLGIGRSLLVRDDLAAGRLVAPFGLRCASPAGYQVLSRPERSSLPKVRVFKQWLLAYFAQS
jgi:LysR family glycine cleavage system transcriptional activator